MSDAVHLLRQVARVACRPMLRPLAAWRPDDLAGVLNHALQGRRLGLDVSGRRVEAEIRFISAEGRAGALELGDVTCEGLTVEQLTVTADAVALTPLPDLGLLASGVEMRGDMSLEALVVWLNPQLSGWRLRVLQDGLIEATSRRGDRRLLVDGRVYENTVTVELRAVRCRGRTVRCPPRLRLARRLPLGPITDDVSITATRAGHRVAFGLTMPVVRTSLSDALASVASSGLAAPVQPVK